MSTQTPVVTPVATPVAYSVGELVSDQNDTKITNISGLEGEYDYKLKYNIIKQGANVYQVNPETEEKIIVLSLIKVENTGENMYSATFFPIENRMKDILKTVQLNITTDDQGEINEIVETSKILGAISIDGFYDKLHTAYAEIVGTTANVTGGKGRKYAKSSKRSKRKTSKRKTSKRNKNKKNK
jgi:hypothetical protein